MEKEVKFLYNGKQGSICIEPLLYNRYYVATYDSMFNLLGTKMRMETLEEAVNYVGELLEIMKRVDKDFRILSN